MTIRNSILIVSVAIVSSTFWACHGDLVGPTSAAREEAVSGNARVSAQARPQAVFKTVPPADADGVILGSGSLTVEFNLCQSRPVNADDSLRYTFDFNGDGQPDAIGHCRMPYTYENPNGAPSCVPTRVCVSDRRSDGEVCRSYEVCLDGGAVVTDVPPAEGEGDETPEPEGEITESTSVPLL